MPYISIVVMARTGDSGLTLRAFAESLQALQAELIVVARGPLPDAPPGVRVVVVPPDALESAARNAGIHQARGEFILSTESDLVFSPELIQFLAERQLQERRLYRIDLQEGNQLHAREGSFTLTPEGLRENPPADITSPQSGIHFGEAWFPPEHDPATGELVRCIGNDAEVVVRIPVDGAALALELEPGPGAGPLPQILHVIDPSGNTVAASPIVGRTELRIWVPGEPGSLQSFRLSVPGGGRAVPDDLRILNFRFFRCDWVRFRTALSPAAPRPLPLRYVKDAGLGALTTVRRATRLLHEAGHDIFGPGIAYWGKGWHQLEEAGPEKFRWVSTNAELVVQGARDLCALVEPGPSLRGHPFHLIVRVAGGREICRAKVSGLTLVTIPILPDDGEVVALSLSPDVTGEPVPGDSRVLNFRVLACACEPSERPAAQASPKWTTVIAAESPASVDWTARLAKYRRQLAEIGKPAFLHVNGCDFLLADRDTWFDLRGYPESDLPPHSLDALFCYSAHFAGAEEELLRPPMRILRAQPAGRPSAPPEEDLTWLITQLRRLHAPAILNPHMRRVDA